MKLFIYVFILSVAFGLCFVLCMLVKKNNMRAYAVYSVYTLFELHYIVMLFFVKSN